MDQDSPIEPEDATTPEEVFSTTELDEEDILGTQTFEDSLYTPTKARGDNQSSMTEVSVSAPVNVLTGEQKQIPTVEQIEAYISKKDAEEREKYEENRGRIGTFTPHVALPVSTEAQVETQSLPFSIAAFYHMKATGHDNHMAYNRAWRSELYDLSFTADYGTGDLTITCSRRE